MSQYAYCPRGGMEGVRATPEEWTRFAAKKGTNYIDLYCPVPGLTGDEPECTDPDCSLDNAVYYEMENGSHGWACRTCGKVLQWG